MDRKLSDLWPGFHVQLTQETPSLDQLQSRREASHGDDEEHERRK